MQLLIDWFGFNNIRVLSEDRKNGTMRLSGICQRAEFPNRNNRIYPKTLLEREINRLKPMISERRLVGELDHPTGPTVSLKNASHMISEVYFKGNDVLCEIVLLNTPAGKVAQDLVNDGVKLGISSRALGSLGVPDNDGNAEVNEDLKFITWDLVADPSTEEAFVGLNENTNYEVHKKISQKIKERVLIEQFIKGLRQQATRQVNLSSLNTNRLDELSKGLVSRVTGAAAKDLSSLKRGLGAAEKTQAGGMRGQGRTARAVISRRQKQLSKVRNYAKTGKTGSEESPRPGRFKKAIGKVFSKKRKAEGTVGSQVRKSHEEIRKNLSKSDQKRGPGGKGGFKLRLGQKAGHKKVDKATSWKPTKVKSGEKHPSFSDEGKYLASKALKKKKKSLFQQAKERRES